MDTLAGFSSLSLFSAGQAYSGHSSSVCFYASCRRAASLHSFCRICSFSKHTERSHLHSMARCRALHLTCSCNPTPSLYRSQRALHSLHLSVFKVFAVDSSSSTVSSDDVEIEREEGMPIPGTITFRRSATQKQFEYFTDLETLGMESFSSELSRGVALGSGIPEAPNSQPTSTPASVSIDVSKEGRDLRLNGVVRTALALNCNRCGIPVAEQVSGEFSLLLTEQPVVEPSKQCVGVVLGGGAPMPDEEEELEDVLDLDLDDKLHFPKTEKSIDISKYIRDTVFLELPLQCLCRLSCRGRCIECGINLNEVTCNCADKADYEFKRMRWGPLNKLKEQLEEGNSAII